MIRDVRHIVILAVMLLVLPFINKAQEDSRKEVDLERLIDEIYPVQDLDINYEDLYENLAQLLAIPLDLNKATREQLRSFFILSEAQINSCLNYRNQQGPFLSIYELQSVPFFDELTISKLINFVSVSETDFQKNIASRILHNANNYLVLRMERTIEKKKGYDESADFNSRYAGAPNKIYSRFRTSQSNDFSLGFTVEKDAGEVFTWNPSSRQYGFDFASFHGQLQNRGKLKNIVVGDYQAQFGQGLTLGGGFSTGKGAETITTLRRSNLGFLPYTSVNEAGFFRGVALSYTLQKNITFHTLLSHTKRDGRFANDSVADEGIFLSSFSYSGLHRTESELAKRKQFSETNIGFVLDYKKDNVEVGVIAHKTTFEQSINTIPRAYNGFGFTGNQNTNIGFYLNYNLDNVAFFSEASQTKNHGRGIIAGMLTSLTHKLDLSLMYRNYARDFYSFYGNALAENTQAQNESGMYWGWKYAFSKVYSLSGYVDLFKFPWLRYRSYSPSSGNEWLIRFNYQPSKKVSVFLQSRKESKQRNLSRETSLYETAQGDKHSYWINCDYAVSPSLSFKSRMQTSSYQLSSSNTKGFALVQDVNFSYRKFSVSARYALFQTDDYDNRLYIYERDAWLGFSFQPYAGVGTRSYLLVQYKASSKIDIWLRWANTSYENEDTIGSGLETINGRGKNDIKTQVRIRF
jgi:hypothetical protein